MMRTKHPLKYLYEQVLGAEQIHLLTHFFQKNVTVENASWKHLIDELRHARDGRSEDFDHTLRLYSCLDRMKTPDCVADMR
jgi:hydroxypyruvate isomerase